MRRLLIAALAPLAGCSSVTTPSPASGDASSQFGTLPDGSPPAIAPATMQVVPAGTFMMGCNAAIDASCDADELPFHMVDVAAFEIDTTEVTAAHYGACMEAHACSAPAGAFDPITKPYAPVVFVRWDDAVAYCTWIGKRLPSEAEWEKAARGNDGRVFPWGTTDADCTRATFAACGVLGAVGAHPSGASPFGLLDTSGNAWEWVADHYDAEYYSVSPDADPMGPSEGEVRTIRGGSFVGSIVEMRASNRSAQTPFYGYRDVGFRCAKNM